MTSSSESHTYFYGRLRIVTRVIWLLLVGLLLATFATGIPLRFNHLKSLVSEDDPITIFGLPSALEAAATLRLGPHEADALQSLGISLDFYAGYILAFDIALVLIGTVIGFLIFWRRPDDWMAVWVSIINVLLGTNAVSLVAPSIALVWPGEVLLCTETVLSSPAMVMCGVVILGFGKELKGEGTVKYGGGIVKPRNGEARRCAGVVK